MRMKLDRISDLQENVTDEILSLLPIQDAVRTSLLSSKWRYKWTMLPDLCLIFHLSSFLLKENLISGCSLLERLHVGTPKGLSHLNINAPNLRSFDVSYFYQGLSFEKTSCLAEVTISHFYYRRNTDYRNRAIRKCSNLLEFFVHLPHIRKLNIQNGFLKYLAVGIEHSKLLKVCAHLDNLTVEIHLDNREDCLAALHLLNGATAKGPKTNFWEEDCFNFLFSKLQIVKIVDIGNTKLELNFVEFLLSKSPELEMIVVFPARAPNLKTELELVKKFLRLRRASRSSTNNLVRFKTLEWPTSEV
ncbi:F-box domain containing protein [Trema orientale]|uniref:F-box domain containing protein n=1 Tax=Trema orientale TaxID=63057 RepID=A0A2P5FZF5_TREOI|nr:F-box domain containing protein [Trema orientale]